MVAIVCDFKNLLTVNFQRFVLLLWKDRLGWSRSGRWFFVRRFFIGCTGIGQRCSYGWGAFCFCAGGFGASALFCRFQPQVQDVLREGHGQRMRSRQRLLLFFALKRSLHAGLDFFNWSTPAAYYSASTHKNCPTPFSSAMLGRFCLFLVVSYGFRNSPQLYAD